MGLVETHHENRIMKLRNALLAGVAAIGIALFVAVPGPVRAQENAPVSIGNSDLGGVVTGPNGPEAGRLGDRRNHRPPNQNGEDRRHR